MDRDKMNDLFEFMDVIMLSEIGHEADREYIWKTLMNNCIQCKEVPKIKRDSKNEKVTENEMNEANKLIASAPLEELIEKYNKAVAHALPSSNTLARAFANRSAVLTNGGMYEDSLKDIERALEIGYPDNLKAKLYARKAKNLLALNKKLCFEVKEAITQAHIWIEKMDESNKKKVLSTLNQLKANKSIKKSVEKWDSSVFFPKTPSGSPKILRAGSIDIVNSEEFGRHIVATKDIKAGETVMVTKFYTFMLKSENKYRNCFHCSKNIYSGVPCNQCSNAMFCNENCRNIAWEEYHDVECAVIQGITVLDTHINTYNIIFSLRLLIKALKEFGTIHALYEKIQEINSIDDPILKYFTGNVFDDTKYRSVYSLFQSNTNIYFTNEVALSIVRILFILSATTEILGKKCEDPTEVVNNKWIFFIGNLIFKHMEIVVKYGIDMPSYCKGKLMAVCGYFLAPLIAVFSHSCDQSAFPLIIRDKGAIIAVQPIKKGEQIFLSYGRNYHELPPYERRLFIQNHFKFFCKCIACLNGWGPTTQHSSLRELSEKTWNAFLKASKNFDSDLLTIVSSTKERMKNISFDGITKMIAEISASLNIGGRDQYLCKEKIVMKYALIELFRYIMAYDSILF